MITREMMLKNEQYLSKYATLDRDAIRLQDFESDFRPNFSRDVDRIIHSLSYTRYIDKNTGFLPIGTTTT